MATTSTPRGDTPSFSEVLDDNGPYIGLLYVINLGLLIAFVDYGALRDGQLTYNTLFGAGVGGQWFAQFTAAMLAAVFLLATLMAVVYAAGLARLQTEGGLDPYAFEERISLITIMPAIQLFALILSPVLTEHTVVEGMQFLFEMLFSLV